MSTNLTLLARDIAAPFLERADASVDHISDRGTVNEVFRVGGEFGVVVRLNSDPHRFGEFEKESAHMELAGSRGVRVPEVLDVGIRDECAFQVQSFVPGSHPPAGDVTAWEELGRLIRRLHGIRPPKGIDPWREQVEYDLSQLGPADRLRTLGLLSAERSDRLRDRWQDLATLPVGLSHGDIALRNVLRADGELVLIDWGSSDFDVVPYADLASLVGEIDPNSEAFDSFLRGYGVTRDEVWDTLRGTATLKAIDLCRWAMDRRPAELERCLRQARWALGFFLEGAGWSPRP